MLARLALCASLTGLGSAATAQGYDVRQDIQVWSAIEQMATGLGTGCQMGDQNGCQAYQYVEQLAGFLVATSDACNYQNDQRACQNFQQAYNQLDNDYGMYLQFYAPQLQAAMGGNQSGMYNPMGSTHQERMNNINNWGAQMLENGRAHSDMMDRNHEAFMESIRN